MGIMPSILSMLIFTPNIGAMHEDRSGGISISSTFLQTFIAISSGKLIPVLFCYTNQTLFVKYNLSQFYEYHFCLH